jgi:tape measure domain-containing protein
MNLSFRRLDRIWVLLAGGSGLALIGTFVKMAAELQRTQLQIVAFTRDLEGVPAVMDSLLALADKVPVSLKVLADGFVKFKAAGLDPISDAQGNGPLKDISDALAAFGASDELAKRAFIAIQQMAGKGVVSMEELRQQLGEAIPLAMRAMAEGMKISVSELIFQVSRGQVGFEKGITAMLTVFREKFGGAGELMKTTFIGALQQSQTEFNRLADTVLNRSGVMDKFTASIQIFNEEIRQLGSSGFVTEMINQFWNSIRQIALWAAEAAPALQAVVSVVGALAGAVGTAISSMPAEIVAAGLFGFILFGRKGIAPGALLGVFSEQLGQVGSILNSTIQSLPSEVVSLGLFGLIIFGLKGLVIGAAIGTFLGQLDTLGAGVASWVAQFKSLVGQATDDPTALFNPIKMNAIALKAGKEASAAYLKGSAPIKSVFGTLLGDDAEKAKGVKSVEDFFNRVEKKAADFVTKRKELAAKLGAIEDVGGLSDIQRKEVDKLVKAYEKLEIKAGSAGSQIQKQALENEKRIGGLTKVIGELSTKLKGLSGEDVSKAAGLQKEIDFLSKLKVQYQELGDVVIENFTKKATANFDNFALKTGETLDIFTKGTDKATRATERHEARMAGLIVQINKQREAILKNTLAGEDQNAQLAELDALEQRVNEAKEKGISTIQRGIGLKRQSMELDFSSAASAFEAQVAQMEAGNSFNKVQEATIRAQQKVDALFESIAKKILKVRRAQADGLISADSADATIQRLEAIQTKLGVVGQEFVSKAGANASAFGEMMQTITSAMESSLSDAIVGLVDGTKSMKDVLLGLYKSITKAAADYIAKLIIMQAFGGGGLGSGGGALGGAASAFGGGGGGFLSNFFGGFAEGGRFLVGGHGGTDSQNVSLRASPGEEVTVGKPGQFAGGGDTFNISISAIDSRSVRELFMREGQALTDALSGRAKLNRA